MLGGVEERLLLELIPRDGVGGKGGDFNESKACIFIGPFPVPIGGGTSPRGEMIAGLSAPSWEGDMHDSPVKLPLLPCLDVAASKSG